MPVSRFIHSSAAAPWALAVLLVATSSAAQSKAAGTSGAAPAEPKKHGELIDEELSLSELMNMKLSLSTRTEQQADEAPSIVSVVSRQDIVRYGARDLADILRFVPGFEFGTDVIGLVGLGTRGVWGHEGKVLMMLNGITVNDLSFGNGNFFGSFPAAMIERVEIIRGPGSAVQGGFAEVSVINVVTRPGAALAGVDVTAGGGLMESVGTWGGNFAVGGRSEDLELALHVGHQSTPLSVRPYRDFFGGENKNGRPESARDWIHIVADGVYKGALKFHYAHTEFHYGVTDGFGEAVPPQPYPEASNHRMDGFLVSYKGELTEDLTLEPAFELLIENSGTSGATPAIGNEFGAPFEYLHRYRFELTGAYEFSQSGQAMLGAGYLRDGVYQITDTGAPGLHLEDGTLKYRLHTDSKFAYLQYMQTLAPLGVTLGARYENTSFGDALAPRAGLVLNEGPLSSKLLYGRAFRIPVPFQTYSRITEPVEGGVKPETSDTVEIQVGYALTPNIKVKGNGFYIHIDEPIVYVDPSYLNFGSISSVGVEFELEARYQNYGGFANAAFAKPGPDTSPDFATPDGRDFLALPPLKVTGGGYARFSNFEFAPTVVVFSNRYGQSRASSTSDDGLIEVHSYAPLAMLNLAVTWHDVLEGTSLQLVGHNIFNARYTLLQPYYGAHAPLPAQDREVRLQLNLSL